MRVIDKLLDNVIMGRHHGEVVASLSPPSHQEGVSPTRLSLVPLTKLWYCAEMEPMTDAPPPVKPKFGTKEWHALHPKQGRKKKLEREARLKENVLQLRDG